MPEARKMDAHRYDEMLELASLGAGVMHSRSIEFAKKFRVPLRVRPALLATRRNADRPGRRTTSGRVVTGLALAKNEARVILRDSPTGPA